MKAMQTAGCVLHVQEEGDPHGTSLVFVNSLGTDLRLWDSVIPRLRDVFRTVRYDKRGHGLSAAPPAPYRLEDHVSDLTGLLDGLGISEAIVCGVSVGGMIAQGLAASRPDLVRGLVLCDTAAKIGEHAMWQERIATIECHGIAALADAVLERWFPPTYRELHKGELALWRNMLVRQPVSGYSGTCAALRDADLTESARAIEVPTLVVGGSADGSTPPELVKSLADLIPGARFAVIDGAGHLPMVDAPEELVRLIQAFFEEAGLAG
jgi:3-oxoadipate enol-lactonase